MAQTISHEAEAQVKTISQTQRSALHALIEARLDGLRGKERNRRRDELFHQLPEALGVEGIKGITPAFYSSAVAWLNRQTRSKDDTSKAALVDLLAHANDQINDLQGQLDALTERIDPSPAPLPDTVNANVLFTKVALSEERDAVLKAADALGTEVEAFRQAVKRMKVGLLHGRNRKAWGGILEKSGVETFNHLEGVHASIGALMAHTRTLAALVTFAQAEDVPESIGEEAGNE